jgi:hypothetical protein
MNRAVKEKCKDFLAKLFILGQRLGFDFLPRHFYSEIPDIRRLKSNDWWKKEFGMFGVSAESLDKQLEFLESLFSDDVKAELRKTNVHEMACFNNKSGGFGRVEADILYAFVRKNRPKRIMQIGCGVSTAVCINASRRAEYKPIITCIEPYPSGFLIEQSRRGIIKLIDKPVEHLEVSVVSCLEDADLLFVDSTHTLGPAGEVSRIILELLPRLKVGVYIHFHDILFPYDYAPNILLRPQFFQHESVLLHAFLAFNSCFKIAASLSMLHYKKQERLKAILIDYDPAQHDHGLKIKEGHLPTSTYLRRTEA